jgi:hypothetical protein
MTTSDNLHASIAASLVVAKLAFSTSLVHTTDGQEIRAFRLRYKVRGADCTVTGYVGGTVFTALAAIRLSTPIGELATRRHELADFIALRAPMIRLMPHPFEEPPGDENLVWIEASVPVPLDGSAIAPWLAVVPFGAVASALEILPSEFSYVSPAQAASLPLLVAGPTVEVPMNTPPE